MSAAVLAVCLAVGGTGALGVLIAIAYRIATGCRHKWVVLAKVGVYDLAAPESKFPRHHDFELRCERCGTLRKKRF